MSDTSLILDSKRVLADLPSPTQSLLLETLYSHFEFPVDSDPQEFLDVVYQGSALDLLQLMFTGRGEAEAFIYDSVCELYESSLDPDQGEGEDDGDPEYEASST